VAVAVKYYLQVTEDHFRQAAQKAAQKAHETTGNDLKQESGKATQASPDSEDNVKFPVISGYFTEGEVGDTGLEPVTSRV